MMSEQKIKENEIDTILSSLGENYHYLKVIANNKIEITKLDFLQKISSMGSLLLFGIMGLFALMTIVILFIAALIVYFANIYGSYLYALLMVNTILIFLSVLTFYFIKPKVSILIEKKMMSIVNK